MTYVALAVQLRAERPRGELSDDAVQNTLSTVASMSHARADHTATRLPDSYDPGTNTRSDAGVMISARVGHTATLLANGTVLITGGYDGASGAPVSTSEIYDPASIRGGRITPPFCCRTT